MTIEDGHGAVGPLLASKVACGGMHTAALRTDESVWCWGRGDSGQLGNGRHVCLDLIALLAFVTFCGICLIPTGVKLDWAVEEREVTLGFMRPHRVQLPPVVQISCGAFHTAAVHGLALRELL